MSSSCSGVDREREAVHRVAPGPEAVGAPSRRGTRSGRRRRAGRRASAGSACPARPARRRAGSPAIGLRAGAHPVSTPRSSQTSSTSRAQPAGSSACGGKQRDDEDGVGGIRVDPDTAAPAAGRGSCAALGRRPTARRGGCATAALCRARRRHAASWSVAPASSCHVPAMPSSSSDVGVARSSQRGANDRHVGAPCAAARHHVEVAARAVDQRARSAARRRRSGTARARASSRWSMLPSALAQPHAGAAQQRDAAVDAGERRERRVAARPRRR